MFSLYPFWPGACGDSGGSSYSPPSWPGVIRYIKRENIIFYPGLKIIDYKLPLIIKRFNSLNRTKKTLTVILNIVLIKIYDEIFDKKITEKGSIKQAKP